MALLPLIFGKPFLFASLILYLGICLVEVFTLKFFTITRNFIKQMMAITPAHPFHKFVNPFLPSNEDLDATARLYGSPIDMDNKVNKITYQKSRLIVFFIIILAEILLKAISTLLFGSPYPN